MKSQEWGENECRLEITNEDKKKQGHREQTDGSVLLKKKKKALSWSLEENLKVAVTLLSLIPVKSSAGETCSASNAVPNTG